MAMRNGTLVLVLTALDPVPEKLLRFMCCKCKILYKSLCSTNICSFQKHGLMCVTACSDCKDTDCNNISLAQQEDDKWEDDVNLFELYQAIYIVLFSIFGGGVGNISILICSITFFDGVSFSGSSIFVIVFELKISNSIIFCFLY